MKIEFFDKLDAFLMQEIGDEWNYTYTAEKDVLDIQLQVRQTLMPTIPENLKDVSEETLDTLNKIHNPKEL